MKTTKKTAKKAPSKRSVKSEMAFPKEPPRSSIEKADNGFIVSKGYGEKRHIAKTLKEAQKIQETLLK